MLVMPAEEERMMRDEQVGVEPDRLVDRRADGVDGEEHAIHRGIGITGDEAGGVPRLCALDRPESIDRRHDLGENGWHAPKPSVAAHGPDREE